jgi:hypothetical protein
VSENRAGSSRELGENQHDDRRESRNTAGNIQEQSQIQRIVSVLQQARAQKTGSMIMSKDRTRLSSRLEMVATL